MKWFKHISKSRNDKFIRDLNSLFGISGEHVFWRTAELLADEFDIKKPGCNSFFIETFKKNYDISFKKTIKILSYCRKERKIFFSIRGHGKSQRIILNFPKLRELCDNWTQAIMKKN